MSHLSALSFLLSELCEEVGPSCLLLFICVIPDDLVFRYLDECQLPPSSPSPKDPHLQKGTDRIWKVWENLHHDASKGLTPHQVRMETGILAHDLDVLEYPVETFYHMVDISAFFHESKATLERDARNHIKGVPLKPGREIHLLTLQLTHAFDEDGRTFICVSFVFAHVCH